MAETAIRHPKRGKVHRSVSREGFISKRPVTACNRWADQMTQRIDVGKTNPADRCARCFPRDTNAVAGDADGGAL